MPIIVLSARQEVADKIQALDTGADSYVTKPFGTDELLACLRAAERRLATAAPETRIKTETFTIDLTAMTIRRDGAIVHLTRTEWGILELLVRYQGCLLVKRRLPDVRFRLPGVPGANRSAPPTNLTITLR